MHTYTHTHIHKQKLLDTFGSGGDARDEPRGHILHSPARDGNKTTRVIVSERKKWNEHSSGGSGGETQYAAMAAPIHCELREQVSAQHRGRRLRYLGRSDAVQ
jgi:hypothetical protein